MFSTERLNYQKSDIKESTDIKKQLIKRNLFNKG